MTQHKSLFTQAILATAAITAERFVSTAAGVPAAAANALGVARSDAASGEYVPVDMAGSAIVVAGAAIAQYALVETDNAGRAVTKSAGVTLGRALQAAAGAGSRIEVFLIPN